MGESTKSPMSASKYYGILGISKSASLRDICKAYKHLVKKWHPDRNRSNQAEAVDKFRSINEAYRVLSKKKREETELLKSDASKTPRKKDEEDDELQISSPTLLSRTTSRISPTVDFYTSMPCFSVSGASTPTTPGTPVSDNLSKIASKPIIFSQSTSRRKPQPIEKKLECTLEELCNGCVKKVMITRDVVATTGEGDDLVLGVEVPLVQALTGCTIIVPLLGGDQITMSFDDEIIHPGYQKIIPGQGMPKPKDEARRGDLVLQFLVEFPSHLSDEQRFELKGLFRMRDE
ncbi:hypothetical protein RND71_039706 [Anisodus tanguticus]|uniref:J domain-containing protein n=1 Tax=Anisodus tanguticus TaxID=243964 RepID=A0AAE1QX45_9SOLA|nr:hypothetical protein RND71_039706 [Anisodus tanguticus]